MSSSKLVPSTAEYPMGGRPLVCVVDDDESVRESLPELLKSFGFSVEAFSSAEEFLTSDVAVRTSCLILDIRMPGMSGSDLQRELAVRRQYIPIVFITAHAEADDRHRVLDEGAVDCLVKPFSGDTLLRAVRAALHA
jgi:FixJ family two-component response regulator